MKENNFVLIIVGIVAIVAIVGMLNFNGITGKGTTTSTGQIVYCTKGECEGKFGEGNCDTYQTLENVCAYSGLHIDAAGNTWHEYWDLK